MHNEIDDNDWPSKAKKVCELEVLTEFLLFHTSGESWPLSHKQDAFWKCASEFVKLKGGAVRSGVFIDTIPYDTGLKAPLCACSLLVVPEVLKRH